MLRKKQLATLEPPVPRRPILPTAPGSVPGLLQIPEDANPTTMTVLAYGSEGYEEEQDANTTEPERQPPSPCPKTENC